MISSDEVKKLGKLSCLHITDDELPELTENLNQIIDYVNQLRAVDTKNIIPMSHVHGSFNVFREDKQEQSLSIDCLNKNAPNMNGRFIKVPIVIE